MTPRCACGDPATTQVHVGTAVPSGRRHYEAMCVRCARDAQAEREWGVAR